MEFGEKLFKLRKEKGLSQESLAEKIGTTRQAISKWENNQGFPETERLLMLGNVFEVSIDYLLKNDDSIIREDKEGYYVSGEMAEGFLLNEKKQSKSIALGISSFILATIPYTIFNGITKISIIPTLIFIMMGVLSFISLIFIDENKYALLKKEKLIFDSNYLKNLKLKYKEVRKRYIAILAISICIIVVGGFPFLLVKKEFINYDILSLYYPVCICLLSVGAYIFIRALSIMEAYELLVKNDEYTNKITFKITGKLREKINRL
ncbi:MAG: helix-turn-helix domain-containing protein [Clostridium sp.]